MALRDQPYLPLYVKDYLTDEKLNLCSPAAQGVYIKIMCVLHKQGEYGCLLLEQKDKQTPEQIYNFACKFAKLLPFDSDVINSALIELVDEDVMKIDGDKIFQKRMVRDDYISNERSKAGYKGGKFAQAKAQAKVEANSANEYVNEYELLDYNTIINILYKEEILHEEIMTKHKLSKDDLFGYIRLFISNQKIEKPGKRTLVDIRKHFNNWIRIQMEKNPIRTDKPGRKVYKGEQDIINEREERRKQWEMEHN